MKKIDLKIAVSILVLFTVCNNAFGSAAPFNPYSKKVIKMSNSLIRSTTKDVSKLPRIAADIAHLPAGLTKLTMAALPGKRIGNSLNQIEKGLITPFRLIKGIIAIPLNIVNQIIPVKKLRRLVP